MRDGAARRPEELPDSSWYFGGLNQRDMAPARASSARAAMLGLGEGGEAKAPVVWTEATAAVLF